MPIIYDSAESRRTYYIIFDKRRGDKNRFWHLFTSKGFDHVYALTGVNNHTLAIKPTPADMVIDEWPINIHSALFYLQRDATAILKYKTNLLPLKPYIPRGIITCVVMLKYLLGLRGGFPFTPLQLYRRLIKEGAVIYGKQDF